MYVHSSVNFPVRIWLRVTEAAGEAKQPRCPAPRPHPLVVPGSSQDGWIKCIFPLAYSASSLWFPPSWPCPPERCPRGNPIWCVWSTSACSFQENQICPELCPEVLGFKPQMNWWTDCSLSLYHSDPTVSASLQRTMNWDVIRFLKCN